MRIAVIGSGYVGTVTAACLAWVGHDVVGIDSDPHRTAELAGGQVPFHEPGLDELLVAGIASDRLTFSSDVAAVADRDVVFLCVGTPTGREGAPDLSQIQLAGASLVPHLRTGTVIVNKSTVPVGSGNWVRTLVEEARRPGEASDFHVVSNPEFLREGSAVDDFLHPDRVVLGGHADGVRPVIDLYQPILEQSFDGGGVATKPDLFVTDLPSAEMIKYAANAFLATKISFANEIAHLCELVGADARRVLPAIGADRRIGTGFLSPGVGWGGSCFGKDVAALIATGTEYGYDAQMLRATVTINRVQRERVVQKLQHELKVLKGRRIALLGLAFKPDTDDLRDAPALHLIDRLSASGCLVSAYDPVVKELTGVEGVRTTTDVYDAACRADAVVIVTDWPQFRDIDPCGLRSVMAGDVVIDGRNMLDEGRFREGGLRVIGVGW